MSGNEENMMLGIRCQEMPVVSEPVCPPWHACQLWSISLGHALFSFYGAAQQMRPRLERISGIIFPFAVHTNLHKYSELIIVS